MALADSVKECLVEVNEVLPELDEGQNNDLLLDGLITNDGVIDGDTSEVEVVCVVGGDEAISDVWDLGLISFLVANRNK